MNLYKHLFSFLEQTLFQKTKIPFIQIKSVNLEYIKDNLMDFRQWL